MRSILVGTCNLVFAQEPVEKIRELVIVDGALPADGRLVKVLKGDRLRWRITSNTPGEVHLHAYRLHVPVRPGLPVEMAFTAFATGRFRLEWHGASTQPASAASHQVAPLATLEVRPR